MKKHFLSGLIFGCGLLVFFCFLSFAMWLFGFFDRLNFFVEKYWLVGDVTSHSQTTIEELVKNKQILPVEDLFTQTLSYYDTLISFLPGSFLYSSLRNKCQ